MSGQRFYLHFAVACLLVSSVCRHTQQPPASSESAPPSPKGTITLLAVGDVNLGRQCGQRILKKGPDYPFRHLREWIEGYDIAICNLESNISQQKGETEKPGNNLIFTAPPDACRALSAAGWDLVSTANNHSADYGASALLETITYLDEAGLRYNGTAPTSDRLYQPTIVKVKDYRLAFLAVTDVTNGPVRGTPIENHLNLADPDCLLPALVNAESHADLTILSYHGGIEYASQPTEATREFAHWAVENGADLILGHHPHVVQGTESYRNGLIIYSLGNFTFVQTGNPWTQLGVAATITITEGRIAGVGLIPIRAHYQAQVIKDAAARDRVLSRISELSLGLAK